jgi:hypothetical protein
VDAAEIVESTPAATGTAIRSGTSGTMMTDEGSDTMVTGMKAGKDLPVRIEADATSASLLDLRPLSARLPRKRAAACDERCSTIERNGTMLWAIAVILLAMWLLGMITSYTLGGFVHVLLVVAVIVVLIRLIQGRRPVL